MGLTRQSFTLQSLMLYRYPSGQPYTCNHCVGCPMITCVTVPSYTGWCDFLMLDTQVARISMDIIGHSIYCSLQVLCVFTTNLCCGKIAQHNGVANARL